MTEDQLKVQDYHENNPIKNYQANIFKVTEYPIMLDPDSFAPSKKVEVRFSLDEALLSSQPFSQLTEKLRLEFERMIVEYKDNKLK